MNKKSKRFRSKKLKRFRSKKSKRLGGADNPLLEAPTMENDESPTKDLKEEDLTKYSDTEERYYTLSVNANNLGFTVFYDEVDNVTRIAEIKNDELSKRNADNHIIVAMDSILVDYFVKTYGPDKLLEYIVKKGSQQNNQIVFLFDSEYKVEEYIRENYNEKEDNKKYNIEPYNRRSFLYDEKDRPNELPPLSLKDVFIFDQLLEILHYNAVKYSKDASFIKRFVYGSMNTFAEMFTYITSSSPQENMLYYLLTQSPDDESLLNLHLTMYLETNLLNPRIKKMKEKQKLFQLCKYIGLFNSTGYPYGYEPLNDYHWYGLKRLKLKNDKLHNDLNYTNKIESEYINITQTYPPLFNILVTQLLDCKTPKFPLKEEVSKSIKLLYEKEGFELPKAKPWNKTELRLRYGLFTLDGERPGRKQEPVRVQSTQKNRSYFGNTTLKIFNRELTYSQIAVGIADTALTGLLLFFAIPLIVLGPGFYVLSLIVLSDPSSVPYD